MCFITPTKINIYFYTNLYLGVCFKTITYSLAFTLKYVDTEDWKATKKAKIPNKL